MVLEEKIIRAIRNKPCMDIDAIAKAVDADTADVSAIIAPLVASGRLHKAMAEPTEGGRRTAHYSVNNGFLNWKPPESSQFKFAQKELTKVELALHYLAKHETASAEELGAAMGLKEGQYPQGWLKPALKDGRIIRDGQNYRAATVDAQPGQACADSAPLAAALAESTIQRPEPPKERPRILVKQEDPIEFSTKPTEFQPKQPTFPGEFGEVTSMVRVKGVEVVTSQYGSMSITANGNTIHLHPGQAAVLSAFVEMMDGQ